MDRREAALAGTPVRSSFEQLGSGQGHDEDRDGSAPLLHVVDEVEEARVGEVQVLEDHDDRTARREPLEERAPGTEELLGPDPRFEAQQREEGGLDPGSLGLVRDVCGEHGRDGGPGRRLVVGLLETGATPDHLAERPERDPVAVRRATAVVPPDGFRRARRRT